MVQFVEIFQYLWTVVLAYAGWLHSQLFALRKANDELTRDHMNFRTEAASKYATLESVREVEGRLSRVLERIDDKVTRILADKGEHR